jgi:hypothetical protein
MEKLGSIAAGMSNGLQTAGQQSGQLSRTTEARTQLRTFLEQMVAAFPHQEIPSDTMKMWRLAFEAMVREHGMERLQVALASFLTAKFFPHPHEVNEVLDQMAKKEHAAQMASLPKIGCQVCLPDGDGFAGFIYTQQPGGPRVVKPCECRTRREQAKKALEGVKG